MLITHTAILDAGERVPGILHRLSSSLKVFFGLEDPDTDLQPERADLRPVDLLSDEDHTSLEATTEPVLRIVKVEPELLHPADGFRWRRHPLLRKQPAAEVNEEQRNARHEAVRGLYAARAGALEVAEEHFARAAECQEIDLSAIPGFWQLNRAAMMTAVEAYERAGRIREASALNARIRTMYRPRALSSMPANVTHLPEPASKISSNS